MSNPITSFPIQTMDLDAEKVPLDSESLEADNVKDGLEEVNDKFASYRTSSAQDVIDSAIESDVKANQTGLTITQKTLSNVVELLKGSEYTLTDGTSPAYTQAVPSGAQKYASLGMLGGKSVVWNQLLDKTEYQSTRTVNGITFTNNGDGSVTASGTATANADYYFNQNTILSRVTVGHKYLILGCPSGGSASSYFLQWDSNATPDFDYGNGYIHTMGNDTIVNIRCRIISGQTVSNIVFKPFIVDLTQLGYGDVTSITDERIILLKQYLASHPEYNAGTIMSAKVDEVESVGANIWTFPIPSAIQALDGYGMSAGSVYNEVDFEPTTYHNMKSVDLGTLAFGGSAGAWTTTIADYVGNPLHGSIFSTQITKSGTTITFATTAQPTGTLHYESTSGGTDYNAKLYKKRVGVVDLGSLSWSKNDSSLIGVPCFNATILSIKAGSNNEVCAIYETKQQRTEINANMQMAIGNNFDAVYMVIRNDSYSDAAAFKTAMSGVMLYYELANPQILDVTDIVPQDTYIETEQGGTVTFHQDDDTMLQVPNKVTYMTKITEAI